MGFLAKTRARQLKEAVLRPSKRERTAPISVMAIYSCNHKAIGRSTQKPFTAAAHINYITRTSATTEIMAGGMPADRHEAVRWIKDQELADRKNARVCDKIMVALPLELTHEQRRELVKDFYERERQHRERARALGA